MSKCAGAKARTQFLCAGGLGEYVSEASKLAEQLRKVCLEHGAVLSHPLLKQLALEAEKVITPKPVPQPPPFPGKPKTVVSAHFAKGGLVSSSVDGDHPPTYGNSPYTPVNETQMTGELVFFRGTAQLSKSNLMEADSLVYYLKDKFLDKIRSSGFVPLGQVHVYKQSVQDPWGVSMEFRVHGFYPVIPADLSSDKPHFKAKMQKFTL